MTNPGNNKATADRIAKAIHAPHVNRTEKRVSRFLQIASSAPNAKRRQAYLERKADQILRQHGFFKAMSEEEKALRQAANRYNLRAFYDPNR